MLMVIFNLPCRPIIMKPDTIFIQNLLAYIDFDSIMGR